MLVLQWRWGGLALCALALPLLSAAQGSRPATGIYSCVDAQGRRLTSDRPIPACVNREQRVLNSDGSVQRVLPPTLTAEERAERDAAERKAELARAAQADAVRRDRNLMARFPDEAAHHKAREAALDTVRLAMTATALRVKELAAERKPLMDESEFYAGRPMPARLRQQLDANDAAVAAQRQATINQELELARINRLYDAELDRLRRLWAGALPGSLPPVAPTQVSPGAPSARR
ncbi:MAG: hypothetical protein KA774_03935 [Burkholderiaceae bacterium]|jgi:hypothetical protein|nr:hypothetical protein [Burkholderiaceae bacterium]